jgi:hypothetical protein
MLPTVQRRLLTAVTAALLALVLAASAHAARGTISGSLSAAPAGAASEIVVAVDPQGVIGGVGTVSSSGAYSLSLAPGTWLVAGSAESGDSALGSFAAPLRVKAGHHARAPTAPLKASAATSRGLPAGSIVTIAPIFVHDDRTTAPPNATIEYTALVTNIMFKQCASRQITFVDTSEAFKKFAQQEANLSRGGRLSTPFEYRPIKPKFDIETEFNEADRTGIKFGLGIHRHGDTETSIGKGLEDEGQVERRGEELESDPTDEEIEAVVVKEASTLAVRMCG